MWAHGIAYDFAMSITSSLHLLGTFILDKPIQRIHITCDICVIVFPLLWKSGPKATRKCQMRDKMLLLLFKL